MLVLIIWYFTTNNQLAFFLAFGVEFLATIPLLKKTWYDPESEDALAWGMAAFAAFLAIFSVSDMKMINIFYPVYAFITNGLICLFGLNLYKKYFQK